MLDFDSYNVMLMIDGQIEAPMWIDRVEFGIFEQNCVKPLFW